MDPCHGCGGLYGHHDWCSVARSYRERKVAFEAGKKEGREEARQEEMERLRRENEKLRKRLNEKE